MDKYAVVTDEEMNKTAMQGATPCSSCGSRSVNYRGMTPHCPNCGTRPWEKNAKKEEGNRRK
jgi:predicted RNA-binding Zn-ribbon protein involved in translation (DUF1610 family)